MKNIIILSVTICLGFLSCKTADMSKSKSTSAELQTASYQVESIKGVELEKQTISIFLNTEEKAVSGNATCNDYRFNYEIDNDQIKMNRGISTKMYCEGKMEKERSFMSQLGKVKYLSQTEKMLYLKDAENKLLIKAKKTKKS